MPYNSYLNLNCYLVLFDKFAAMQITTLKKPEYLKSGFELNNGIILIDVQLNGQTRNFFFDSGAAGVVLNSRYIKPKDFEGEPSTFNGISGKGKYSCSRIKKLQWQNLVVQNKKVGAIDMSHLENAFNKKIYGLIGYGELSDYTVKIDYKSKSIEMWTFFDEAPFNILKKIPFVMYKHIPVLEVLVGNVKLKLGIDTGATGNLIDIRLQKKLAGHLHKTKSGELSGGDKGIQRVEQFKLDQLLIGNVPYKNMRFVFSKFDHIRNNVGNFDGLIGYEFLKKRKIAIGFKKGELYFIKSKAAKK